MMKHKKELNSQGAMGYDAVGWQWCAVNTGVLIMCQCPNRANWDPGGVFSLAGAGEVLMKMMMKVLKVRKYPKTYLNAYRSNRGDGLEVKKRTYADVLFSRIKQQLTNATVRRRLKMSTARDLLLRIQCGWREGTGAGICVFRGFSSPPLPLPAAPAPITPPPVPIVAPLAPTI
uniref:Uncharacterized protein n=1 Tax=Anopheles atroparvus TaxID=41427 RepID=A0A182IL86_ANOAO